MPRKTVGGPRRSTAQPQRRAAILRVALLSDLHVYSGLHKGPQPSYISTGAPHNNFQQSPLAGLRRLIETDGLRADVLLSGGDMAHQADPTALSFAWTSIHNLGQLLGAKVYATVGNHDLDSRYAYDEFDEKASLQALRPPFPTGDDAANDRYWARNFALIDHGSFQLVLLNSSAHHRRQDELNHGRVSQATISQIANDLRELGPSKVRLLLCHHHPSRYGDIDVKDYSEMTGGHLITELLGSGSLGQWIIFHGHRHFPRLAYAAGGSMSPILFSAGSLSAVPYPELAPRARNQFYVIDFEDPEPYDLMAAGTFRAWDWIPAVGWQPAQHDSGLPAQGGFGYRPSLPALTRQMIDGLGTDTSLRWDQLLERLPLLRFLLPRDLDALAGQVEALADYGLIMENGRIAYFGRS